MLENSLPGQDDPHLFWVVCGCCHAYKRYPIYTQRVCKIYIGKRRKEVLSHLRAIAECAYRNMGANTKDNANLITGESGVEMLLSVVNLNKSDLF